MYVFNWKGFYCIPVSYYSTLLGVEQPFLELQTQVIGGSHHKKSHTGYTLSMYSKHCHNIYIYKLTYFNFVALYV